MSDVIDWSKAPEGYPLWLEDLQATNSLDQSGWHRDDGDRYTDTGGRYWPKRDIAAYKVHTRPQPTPWSGEGLPPVGLTVRIPEDMACGNEFLEQFEGLTVEIVGHTENDINTPLAIFRYKLDGSYHYHALCGDNGNFEPIRTPEQIAADERDNRAHDLFRIAWPETHSWRDLSPHWQEAFYRLADSSYRKP